MTRARLPMTLHCTVQIRSRWVHERSFMHTIQFGDAMLSPKRSSVTMPVYYVTTSSVFPVDLRDGRLCFGLSLVVVSSQAPTFPNNPRKQASRGSNRRLHPCLTIVPSMCSPSPSARVYASSKAFTEDTLFVACCDGPFRSVAPSAGPLGQTPGPYF